MRRCHGPWQKGSLGLMACPLQLFFLHTQMTPLGDITSACTLPSDMANTNAATFLVKLYVFGSNGYLWGEANWFAKQADTQAPVSPCNQIIHLSTRRATVKFEPGQNLQLFVVVGSEKLAKCLLKLLIAHHTAWVWWRFCGVGGPELGWAGPPWPRAACVGEQMQTSNALCISHSLCARPQM